MFLNSKRKKDKKQKPKVTKLATNLYLGDVVFYEQSDYARKMCGGYEIKCDAWGAE